jgi:hypothetical protein
MILEIDFQCAAAYQRGHGVRLPVRGAVPRPGRLQRLLQLQLQAAGRTGNLPLEHAFRHRERGLRGRS